MSERDAVLFANEAFYRAFADRDVDAMTAVWAEEDEISCLHPGWPPLYGYEAVMKSWLGILSNPNAPKIYCRDAVAVLSDDLAYVTCFEQIDQQYLIATNIFRRFDDAGPRWRMLHHHGGPTDGKPEDVEPSSLPMN